MKALGNMHQPNCDRGKDKKGYIDHPGIGHPTACTAAPLRPNRTDLELAEFLRQAMRVPPDRSPRGQNHPTRATEIDPDR